MKPIVLCDTMRAMEKAAFDAGIVPADMMEEAASAVTEAVLKSGREKRAAVICGGGNNGGDGLAAARMLIAAGWQVDVLLTADPASLRGDAALNLHRLEAIGPHWIGLDVFCKTIYPVIVDAMMGIGLGMRPMGETNHAIIAAIREQRAKGAMVVSVDIPSGIMGDSGHYADGEAVEADITVTFAAKKPAHILFPGRAHAGKVRVAPLTGVTLPKEGAFCQITAEDADTVFPARPMESHKGTFGHALVISGSAGMMGAGALSSASALRTGAGLVSWCYPDGGTPNALRSVMARKVPGTNGMFSEGSVPAVSEMMMRATAAAVGPGLGRSREVSAFVKHFIGEAGIPFVLDADGLNALNGEYTLMKGCRCVLTPHPGEMSLLTGRPVSEIMKDPAAAACRLAEETGCTVLLKGGTTVIAQSGKVPACVISGNPGMATAGSGDILTGIIASLLAQGLEPWNAAWAGAYIHGHAGTIAARHVGMAALTAEDILAALPEALPKRVWDEELNL